MEKKSGAPQTPGEVPPPPPPVTRAREAYAAILSFLQEKGKTLDELPLDVRVPIQNAGLALESAYDRHREAKDSTTKSETAGEIRKIEASFRGTLLTKVERYLKDESSTSETPAVSGWGEAPTPTAAPTETLEAMPASKPEPAPEPAVAPEPAPANIPESTAVSEAPSDALERLQAFVAEQKGSASAQEIAAATPAPEVESDATPEISPESSREASEIDLLQKLQAHMEQGKNKVKKNRAPQFGMTADERLEVQKEMQDELDAPPTGEPITVEALPKKSEDVPPNLPGIEGEMPAVFRSARREPSPEMAGQQTEAIPVLKEEVTAKDFTPREWREQLQFLINQTKLKAEAEGGNEKLLARMERVSGFLTKRDAELKEEAKASKIEGLFRSLGAKYNKVGWKTKLGVGLGLGIGAGVAGSFGLFPVTVALLGGVATQRVAGLASMFLKYEKSTAEGKWQKEIALGKAALQSALMTGAMLTLVEGVKEATDYARGEEVHGWLHDNWPFGSTQETGVPETMGIHPAEAAGQITEGAPTLSSPEAVANENLVATAEVPVINASSHGYEGMLKDLWSQLHAADYHAPANLDANSDLAQLLEAGSPEELNAVVHNMALQHNFAQDAGSVRIDTDAFMTVDPQGYIHLHQGGEAFIDAAKEMALTQQPVAAPVAEVAAPAPEVAVPQPVEEAPTVSAENVPYKEPFALDASEWEPGVETAGTPEVSPGSAEPMPEPFAMDATPWYQQPTMPEPETGVTTASAPEVPVVEEARELPPVEQPALGAEHIVVFENPQGLLIDSGHPALYEMTLPSGETQLVAYGGTDEERFSFIQDYLAAHAKEDVSIRWAHSVPSIFGSSVRVEDLSPAPEGSAAPFIAHTHFFQPKAPDPDTFVKVINSGAVKK